MKLFDLFKRYLTPQTKLSTITPQKESIALFNDENAIAFCINKNGELIIKISAQNTDDKSALKFAEVLLFMGRDLYRDQLLGMLNEMSVDDPPRQQFIQEVLSYYKSYVDTFEEMHYNKEVPLVSPSKFYSIVQHTDKQNE